MRRVFPLAAAAALALCSSPPEAADLVTLDTLDGFVHRAYPDDPSSVFTGWTGYTGLEAMATDGAGTVYAYVNSPEFLLVSVDPVTGAASVVAPSNLTTVRGLAMSGGVLYAIADFGFQNDDRLYTIDTFTGDTNQIGTTDHETLTALAADANGTLYSWDQTDGLVEVDPATAATTDVNGIPDGGVIQTLAFAPDGTLYAAWEDLHTVDTATGTLSPSLGDLGPATAYAMEFHDYADCLRLEVAGLTGGGTATFTVHGPPDGATVALVYGVDGGSTTLAGQAGFCATFDIDAVDPSRVIAQGVVQAGELVVDRAVPASVTGRYLFLQAAEEGTCPAECVSNLKGLTVD